MLIVGIDPGATGACAVLDEQGDIAGLIDLPIVTDRSLSWVDGARLQSFLIQVLEGRQARAVVERVGSMPRQGVASSFKFGSNLGSILSLIQARHLPLSFVTAASWKRDLALSAEKRAALDKARLMFPGAELHLAKHDGRAEALLIAHWGRLQHDH